MYLAVVALSASLPLIAAHGFVRGVKVNNAGWTPGADPVWFYSPAGSAPKTAGWNALNQDFGFVQPSAFQTAEIACHKSATPSTLSVNANAGDTLTFFWNTWPESHKGPVINYMASCNGDCSTRTAASLGWSKISQSGLLSGSGPGKWATDSLLASNLSSSMRIPPRLKAGNYVVRHEIIALHGAGSDNGAQSYPQCVNVKVGGGGTVALPSGTPGASLYRHTDPGILFNLYTTFSSYPYPGSALWTGAN